MNHKSCPTATCGELLLTREEQEMGQCLKCQERVWEGGMRYECAECGSVEQGEADCLKHAQKYGHQGFYDWDTPGVGEPGIRPKVYEPEAG